MSNPFILIARIRVKEGKVEEYLKIAKEADDAVNASEPDMLIHTFDQDPTDPLEFTWSEVYRTSEAMVHHINNPPVVAYVEKHQEIADKIRMKFGPYRNYMDDATSENIDIPDLNVKYANIGKSNKCDDLWSGCDELTDQLSNNSQAHFAHAIILCETAPNKDTKCRISGWPQKNIPY